MVGKCAICKKKVERGSGPFFRVPEDPAKRLMWENNCRMHLKRDNVVCADHFSRAHMICGGKKARLLPRAVPYPASSDMSTDCTPVAQHPLAPDSCCNYIGIQEYAESTVLAPVEVSSVAVGDGRAEARIEDNEMRTNSVIFANVESSLVLELSDAQTQTDCVIFEALVDPELLRLKKEVKSLEKEVKKLRSELNQSNAVLENFKKIFTEGQIRKMVDPDRSIQWHWTDISSAICLHAAGPRAYHHLYDKGFPLPHVATLKRWCGKTDMSEGLLAASFDSLQHMSELSDDDKKCVLAFDEMKVAESYEYDQLEDSVRNPPKEVQVLMARGLLKSWKQPLFYAFDTEMNKDILHSIIVALKNINYTVVAIVCDMGSKNQKLWKELKVTIDDPWFPHPSDETLKVYTFADAPHLLKLMRKHYLNTGIKWNGLVLTTKTICDLLEHTSGSDISIAHKISHDHISVNGPALQKVKTAAQLFSNTVANAIRRCYSLGYNLYEAVDTADFIQLINDWFDVLNSNIKNFGYPGKEPFGKALSNQMDVINRMNEFMSLPIIPGKKSLQIFQKGILMTNRALVGLYNDLKDNSNVEYILTNRLNQDIVENFFGAIRSKGGLNDHPSPKEFQYRLRKYILARNTETLRGTGNVANDDTEWLVPQNTSTPLKPVNRNKLHLPLGNINKSSRSNISTHRNENEENCENSGDGDDCTHEQREVSDVVDAIDSSIPDDSGILQDDALSYISGYMIKKLNLEELRDTGPSFGFIDQVSRGFLKKPAPQLLQGVKTMEKIFHQVNGNEICHNKNLHQRLVSSAAHVKLPESVKSLFYKCRIYFRIRNLNKRMKIQKAKQRLMGHKKFLKIKL